MNILKNPQTECQNFVANENVLVSDNYIEENIITLEDKKNPIITQNRKRKINLEILGKTSKKNHQLKFPFLA